MVKKKLYGKYCKYHSEWNPTQNMFWGFAYSWEQLKSQQRTECIIEPNKGSNPFFSLSNVFINFEFYFLRFLKTIFLLEVSAAQQKK